MRWALATDRSMVIRVAANLQELKKNLAEGKAQIETTTAAMSKLASSFSGDKLVQHAHNVVAAINQIGDASMLSAGEAARQLTVLDKAMEKLTLTGKPIPAAMQSTADALRRVADSGSYADKAMGFLKSTFGQMVGAFTVVNLLNKGVSTLVSWGKEAVDAAGATIDFANQTGLSTDTIQRFQHVAKQTGSTLEGFTNASYQLGLKLNGGSDSVRAAVQALGLQFSELRSMSPDQQFERITAAAGNLTVEQGRNKVAAELFGKAAKDVLPAITEGYKRIADEAAITGRAQLKALDDAGDAWDAFVERQKKGLQGWLGNQVMASQAIAKLNANQQEQLNDLMANDAGKVTAFLLQIAKAQQDVNLPLEKHTRNIYDNTDAKKAQAETDKKVFAAMREYSADLEKADLALRKITLDVLENVKAHRQQLEVFPPLIEHYGMLEARMEDTRSGSERMRDSLKAAAAAQDGEFKKAAEQTHAVLVKAKGALDEQTVSVEKLAQAMTNLAQTTKSSFVAAMASMVNAVDVGTKAIGSLKSGFDKMTADGEGKKSILGGFVDIVSGIGGIVSAAQSAIQIGKMLFNIFDRDKGRDLVEKFAAEFGGGFDEIQGYMALLGDEGRRLWATLTQGKDVHNSPDAARRAIDAVREAIERLKSSAADPITVAISQITRTDNRGEIEEAEQNSFAGGTGGFRNFGSGTYAKLHNWEAVIRPGDVMPDGGDHETVVMLDGDVLVRHIENRLSRKLRNRQHVGAV